MYYPLWDESLGPAPESYPEPPHRRRRAATPPAGEAVSEAATVQVPPVRAEAAVSELAMSFLMRLEPAFHIEFTQFGTT